MRPQSRSHHRIAHARGPRGKGGAVRLRGGAGVG